MLDIPKVSMRYTDQLTKYINKTNIDLYEYINKISGLATDVEISISCAGMGGCKSYRERLREYTGFDRLTVLEFKRFYDFGYSPYDFQHMCLDAYIIASMYKQINKRSS